MKEQLGDEDFETHYNLGIAYKEMGLIEEALGEFSLAEKSPVRRMDAVSMIALCLREHGPVRRGRAEAAHRDRARRRGQRAAEGLPLRPRRAARAGRPRRPRRSESLERLHAIDPGYRDVAVRVGGGAPPAAGHPAQEAEGLLPVTAPAALPSAGSGCISP